MKKRHAFTGESFKIDVIKFTNAAVRTSEPSFVTPPTDRLYKTLRVECLFTIFLITRKLFRSPIGAGRN